MTIERTVYFANADAYSIMDTQMWMDEMKYRMGDSFPDDRLDVIQSFLSDMKFLDLHWEQEWLPDVTSGVLKPLDVWFLMYGIRCPTFAHFDGDTGSIHTFPTDDSSFTNSDSSVIDSEDERILTGNIEIDDDCETLTLLSMDLSVNTYEDWEIPATDDENSI